jgi:hypothetical protein
MAAITKNRNFFKWPKLLYFKPESLKSSSLCLYSSNLGTFWLKIEYPRWPPLLKIEISSNGQNCSILSQKVPKFELYKHNDELFKHILRDLYSSNLGTFWLKIEQFWPFEEISIFSNGGHLGYRTALTDTILKGDKIEISSNGQNCSILSQKVPKFELYKHNDEIFNIYYGIFYEL